MAPEPEIRICRTNLKILKYSFIWPNENEEMNPGKRFYLQLALFLLVIGLWVGSVLAHFVVNLRSHADVHLSEDLSFIFGHLGDYYMIIIYARNQPKVAGILRDLSRFDKFGKPPGFEEKEKKLAFYSVFGLVYTVVAIFIYNGIKFFQKGECEANNLRKGLREICGVLSPVWLPFEITNKLEYFLVLLYLFLASQFLLKVMFLISFNALEIGHHISLRIDHLKIMIDQCFDGDYEAQRQKLNLCIQYHMDIISFSKRLDNCFSTVMLVHLTITGTICGCLEKHFIDGDTKLGSALHAGGWILALFTACLGGQQFIDANESLPVVIYNSKWYEADTRLRKDLLFMLTRSQVSSTISVGPFSFLSFSLFVSVLKMSYSIFAMLSS